MRVAVVGCVVSCLRMGVGNWSGDGEVLGMGTGMGMGMGGVAVCCCCCCCCRWVSAGRWRGWGRKKGGGMMWLRGVFGGGRVRGRGSVESRVWMGGAI